MRFGKTLARSVYPPWADHYVDYAKLKRLLREDSLGRRDAKQKAQEGEAAGDGDMGDEEWTEEDEKRFCDEVFNVQLEKVACFQQDRVCDLRARIDAAMERLKLLAPVNGGEQAADGVDADAIAGPLRELEAELDAITDQVNQVKRYSGDNYTGFLKIVKKHDRKRGQRYRIRPLMQLSLAQRPFNSLQAYTPLLDRLSVMYFAIHQVLDHGAEQQQPRDPDSQREWHNGERYSAHKCTCHRPSGETVPHPALFPCGETSRSVLIVPRSLGSPRKPCPSQDLDLAKAPISRLQRASLQGHRGRRCTLHNVPLPR